ncbi:MAG: acyl-CoA dehydrogenase family protein [Actinomycetota bacterium]
MTVEAPGVAVPDVETFRAEAIDFLRGHADAAPRDYGAIMPPELRDEGVAWQRVLAEHGFAGIHRPVDLGGRGLTPEHQAVWLEECARAGVPPFLNMVGHVLAVGSLLRYGTDEQQQRWIPPTLAGEVVWCQLFSEPGAGSDLAGLSTKAVRDGDGWVVDGQKVWSSASRVSELGILLARTDPDAPKHAGISFFVIDMATEGVEPRPLRQMTGDAEFDEVFLTAAHLPDDALLGPLHGGWGVAMSVLTDERGSIGASIISLERRLAAMAGLGGDLDRVERERLTALLTRGTTYQYVAQRQAAGASTASSLLKLGITELGFDQAELRVDLSGAEALLDGAATTGLLAAPGGRIAGGSSQIQRNIIGERLLGLPKEPRPT